jgi:hypothetical protein
VSFICQREIAQKESSIPVPCYHEAKLELLHGKDLNMSSLQPLRDELFRHRKHKQRSLDGSVPGLPYVHYRQLTTPPLGSARPQSQGGYQDDLYNGGMPREYHPNLNAPAVQADGYMADADEESHWVGPSRQERPFRPIPERMPVEPRFDYEESKAVNEFLLTAMEVLYRQSAEGEEVSTLADLWQEHSAKAAGLSLGPAMDTSQPAGVDPSFENGSKRFPSFADLALALHHLRTVLPEDHPDIIRLQAAAHEMLQHLELLPQPEDFGVSPTASRLGTGNPYEVGPIGPQEQGMVSHPEHRLSEPQDVSSVPQTLDDLLTAPEFDVDILPATEMMRGPTSGLDAILGPVDGYPELGTLDHIMEQDLFGTLPMEALEEAMGPDLGMYDSLPQDMYGMTPEQEINQAIDQAAGRMAPEFDPYMMAQQIFDQQMQFMANPFLMPGMGPMPGPAPGM